MRLPSKPEQPAGPSRTVRRRSGGRTIAVSGQTCFAAKPGILYQSGQSSSVQRCVICLRLLFAHIPPGYWLKSNTHKAVAPVHWTNHDGLQPSRVAAPHAHLLSLSLVPTPLPRSLLHLPLHRAAAAFPRVQRAAPALPRSLHVRSTSSLARCVGRHARPRHRSHRSLRPHPIRSLVVRIRPAAASIARNPALAEESF